MIIPGVIASSSTNYNQPKLAGNTYTGPVVNYAQPVYTPTVVPSLDLTTSTNPFLAGSVVNWTPTEGSIYNITVTSSTGVVSTFTQSGTLGSGIVGVVIVPANSTVSVQQVSTINGVTTYGSIQTPAPLPLNNQGY